MSKKFVSNRLGRFAELGKSLTKATGHLALERVEKAITLASRKKEEVEGLQRKAKAAKEIIKSMGELKGALMKIGQMLSITEDLVIPPEISKLFTELQKNAPSMRDEELDAVFLKSFGKTPDELFQFFERKPMAAASIGQVHQAVLKTGEKVAVKVQYPKIVKAIRNDFENLEGIKKLVTILFPKTPNIESYLLELKRSLEEECDYKKEREALEYFRLQASEQFPQILIPKTFPDFCSETILTMERMEGDDYVTSKSYPPEIKDQLGQWVYDFHNFCFYELKRIHTDPQYGNFLFQHDKIIMLDFGSIRSFDDDFIRAYINLLKSIEKKDLSTYREILLYFGFFEESDDQELFERHLDMVSELYEPYTRVGKNAIPPVNPVDLVKGFVDNINLKGRKSPREEFLLLDRAHLGLYTKLRGWQSRIDWITSKEKGFQLYESE